MVPEVIVEKLSKSYEGGNGLVQAIEGVSLCLEAGSFTALVGYSGCGKSTLLRLLAGLERPDSGRIIINPSEARPSVVFQDPRLLPWMNLKRNLQLALKRGCWASLTELDRQKKIVQSLKMVGLSDRLEAYPHELSGGMAQRAGLARALSRNSGFLLMDEPFSALDALNREALQRELHSIWKEGGPTCLFITHDIGEALFLAERILVMGEGKILADLSREKLEREKDPKLIIREAMDDVLCMNAGDGT